MTKPSAWLKDAGRLGGLARAKRMGAKARRASAKQAASVRWKGISEQERKEAARKAVLARWAKYRKARKQQPR